MNRERLRAMLDDSSLLNEAMLVGGDWCQADDGATIAVTDPATGGLIGHVPAAGAAETNRAIAAAAAALPGWRATTAKARAVILRRLFELMMAAQEDLARIMTAEQGKPLAESRAEIAYAASFIEWFAEEGKRVYGDIIPPHLPGRDILVRKEPIGVFAAITPWNFPAAMMTRKVGPGWAAGCTGILRPASETPFSAIAIALLAERAGLPPGVCNLVTGPGPRVGGALCAHPEVRKLSFTGSTATGATLLAQCAPTIKKTSMELGGNAPFIVFEDADLEAAVEGAVSSKYRNAGQTCVCTNRFLVQTSVHDAFADRLAQAVGRLTVGNGFDDGTMIGPLIDDRAVAKVRAQIDDAVARGATLVRGGEVAGRFVTPAILGDVDPDALIFHEETFGPVAPLFRFDDEADAMRLANATPFGLAAYVYTRDIGRVMRVTEALEFGIVGVNEGLISTEVAPFGGIKASGMGREGSRYGIEDYLEIKYVCIRR